MSENTRQWLIRFTVITMSATILLLVFLMVNPQDTTTAEKPVYSQQVLTVGDIKWLCLTNNDKPISCQLISPLTDDKLNNYKHINVL